ncbi:MAG: maltokinase N-terminal cap-like domain-containing protein [Actinomycetota bacterium]
MNINVGPLIHLLPEQRWFGSKDRALQNIEVRDHAIIEGAHDGGESLVLALLDVHFVDGLVAIYQMPLLVNQDGDVRDALDDAGRLNVFGRALARGETFKGERGAFRFGGPGLDPLAPPGHGSVRAMGAEQSNSSIVLDDSVILKLIRRVEEGDNPELELNRFLTNEGFEYIPAQVGEIFYEEEHPEGEVGVNIDLGIAQQYVSDATEGWSEALKHVAALYDGISGDEDVATRRRQVDALVATLLEELAALGDVTAGLHVLLGRGQEHDPEIGRESATHQDLRDWAMHARHTLSSLPTDRIPELTDEVIGSVNARLDAIESIVEPGAKTRIHGDYHLGQTLLGPRGWLILDFEGEPLRSLEERRALQSPLRDVAGMLRSFSYAAYSALLERAEPDSERWNQLEPWVETFEELARHYFLQAYLRTSHEGDLLPHDRDELGTLLDFFELDKALYEVGYELGHRPDWVRIPLRGILDVVNRGGTR